LPVVVLALRARVPLPAVPIEPVALTRRSLEPLRLRLPAVAEIALLIARAPLLVAMLEGLDCTLGVLVIAATDWKLVLTLVELQQGAY
jgi:hypothetical protein